MKKMFRVALFILIAIMLFSEIQHVLIPVSVVGQDNADHIIQGVKGLEDDSIDVLFAGTSLVELGVSSMKLYKDFGICAYSVASIYQPIEVSYFLLEYAMRNQHPKIIMLDVSGLFLEDNAERAKQWRVVLDNFKLSPLKLKMAKSYSELNEGSGYLAALFPIIEYHTRWSQLCSGDFNKYQDFNIDYYSLGQEIKSGIMGDKDANVDDVNYYADNLKSQTLMRQIENGIQSEELVPTSTYSRNILTKNVQYFEKILSLCQKYEAQLILFKIPTMTYPQYDKGTWTIECHNQTSNMADKYSIPFIDFMYDTDIGIDWGSDSYDGGKHLNYMGAEKVATAVGSYLKDNFALQPKDNNQYNFYEKMYDKVINVCTLQAESDFINYIKLLEDNAYDWSVFVAASDEYTQGMEETCWSELKNLGLKLSQSGQKCDAYAAAIVHGEVKFEAVSGSQIQHSIEFDKHHVDLISSGWKVGSKGSILIDENSYSMEKRGLNFVVFDNETELVIDSVCFDTCVQNRTASRNDAHQLSYLRDYEAAVCFDGQ